MSQKDDKEPRALRDAVRRLLVAHSALNEAKRPCGAPLSTAHAWSLLELREHGALTCTALAEHLRIDRTNVSRLCHRMESSGEVERIPHPTDGRARLVRLTPKGERLAEDVDRSSTEHFARVRDQLTANVDDVIETVEILTHALSKTNRTNR
jgi:DNA-binding MarR family transcriptional regulator